MQHSRSRLGSRPTTVRVLWLAILAIASALALTACGGGAAEVSGSVRDGARFAPATAPAFVEFDTDVHGAQWRQADALLDKFPGRADLLESFRSELEDNGLNWERDIRPALGPAFYTVWLDFANDGDDVVGYTKPADRTLFSRLLDKQDDPKLVHREIDGWTVLAESEALLDRFEQARSDGSLGEEESFRDALEPLPDSTLVRAYVSGRDVQRRLDEAFKESGSDALTQSFGKLESLSAALTAEGNGVLLAADAAAESTPDLHQFKPELPDSVPSGALLYVSFGDVKEQLDRGLSSIEDSVAGFAQQRAAAEAALDLSFDKDIFPLFGKEGGFAVYRGTSSTPGFALYLRVDDEDAARKVVDRLGAIAQLGEAATTRTFTLEGAEVREIDFTDTDITLYATVSHAVATLTNSEAVLRDSLDGGQSLADDPAYKSAGDAAEVPDEVTGLVYIDLHDGIPAFYDATEGTIPADVRENVDPLGAVVVYGRQDGDHQRLSGFLQIH